MGIFKAPRRLQCLAGLRTTRLESRAPTSASYFTNCTTQPSLNNTSPITLPNLKGLKAKTSTGLQWKFYCHEIIIYLRYEIKRRDNSSKAGYCGVWRVCITHMQVYSVTSRERRWRERNVPTWSFVPENGSVVGGPESQWKALLGVT